MFDKMFIDNMIAEGKITQEQIDKDVYERTEELQASRPHTQEEIKVLKERQEQTENVVMALLMGGM